MIQFTCSYCQAALSVPDERAGQSGRCPKCQRTIRVPVGANAPAPLMPPGGARARVVDEEIPLADDSPPGAGATPAPQGQRPRASGPGMARAALGGEEAEIPMAMEPAKGSNDTPPQEEPTAGGLVISAAGDATVVSFQHPKILDAMEIDQIGKELYALVDHRGCRKIALDFGNVKFLSSQMLGVLITLQKKVAAAKGRLLLCAVQADLQKVFKLVKLEQMLPIVPDRHTALGVLGLP